MNICSEIDEDIRLCKDVWERFSYDADELQKLFNSVAFKYVGIIDGFTDNMDVVSPFDSKAVTANALRQNVSIILERLEIVKNSGYKTDCLKDYYLNENVLGEVYIATFNEVRKSILDNEKFSNLEKDEFIGKIDSIESIVTSIASKKDKWERLRPYIVWLSGKDVNEGLLALGLIQRIN